MQELNLRLGQAVALTYAQTDENFKRLKTAIDALEVAVAGAGLGTVTSVGLTLPNIFTVTNSPVTTTGSLTATLASQSANRMFASPNGSAGQPTFRSLVAADLPTVPIAKGGLGLTTVATNNQVLASDGTNYEGRTISVSGGLTLTNSAGSIAFGLNPALINITGFAGVLTVAKGGTGLSTPPANGALLIGNGTSYASATLTAGSGISITNGVGTVTIAATAAGVSTLNTLSGNLNMLFGTAATNLAIVPSGSDIQFNIPDAGPSPVTRGLLTAADWTTFNNKVGGSGTAGTIPIFTGTNSIGNSRLTYTSAFATDTIDFASVLGLAVLKATGTVGGEVRAGATGVVTYINADATASNFGWTNAKPLNFVQGGTTRASFDASGNFAMNGGFNVLTSGNVRASKGFALNGIVYWNTASNYAFANNELYGVVLGPTSPNTMTVTLPAAPMDGQEICILIEENKTLTIDSGVALRNIYGQDATPATTVVLTISLSTHGSVYIFKFLAAGNGGAGGGAWYLTGY